MPFTNVSMTGTGIVIFFLMTAVQWLGLDFSQTQATMIVKDVIDITSFILTIWGQLRRKDLQWGLFRV